MISRRNIRVKVMQTLYTLQTTQGSITAVDAEKILQKHLDQSRQLFVYLIYFLTEVARYAEKDARQKGSKHLPTKEDLSVNIKIAGNEILWRILEDESFKKAVTECKPNLVDNGELVRKFYLQLVETPEYKAYISEPSREKKAEKEILEFIFSNLLLPSESFISHLEENFIHWDDDAEMMNQLVLNFLQKPAANDFREMISQEKWKFAKDLLRTVEEKKEFTLDMIKPRLKNWDADRIALLDMILMQMGVCEFLFFETIPTKVTINEYIDLAKEYSTPQSGQFVNGILDNIHKDLQSQDKLHKISFRKN